ncbi:hypothetical protein ACOSP7_000371 [Xanthoceras sorbifolium]
MAAHNSVKGAILTRRYTPPTHYLFKIESFSKLTKAIVDKYSSDKFDAEGFSWKLSIYPTGDKSKNGEGHISIYMELDTSLAVGTDVNVIINVFVFNHLEDRYLSFQDFGDYRYYWYISLFPKGVGKSKGNSISIYLYINAIKSKIPIDRKLFTKFILRIKDQTNGNHIEIEDNYLYSSDNYVSGGVEFLSLAKLKDPKMGFLVDDTVIIEAKVTLLGLVMKES